jgi:hypothetical protein
MGSFAVPNVRFVFPKIIPVDPLHRNRFGFVRRFRSGFHAPVGRVGRESPCGVRGSPAVPSPSSRRGAAGMADARAPPREGFVVQASRPRGPVNRRGLHRDRCLNRIRDVKEPPHQSPVWSAARGGGFQVSPAPRKILLRGRAASLLASWAQGWWRPFFDAGTADESRVGGSPRTLTREPRRASLSPHGIGLDRQPASDAAARSDEGGSPQERRASGRGPGRRPGKTPLNSGGRAARPPPLALRATFHRQGGRTFEMAAPNPAVSRRAVETDASWGKEGRVSPRRSL